MNKKEKIANLTHALNHLTANHIDDDPYEYNHSWYYGQREGFVIRHKKSKAFIEQLIEELRT